MSNDLAIIEQNLFPMREQFQDVLPPSLSVERFMRTAVQAAGNNAYVAKVLRETPESLPSFLNSAMSAAVLGLEADGVTGQSAIVPFKRKFQLIPMAGGYITLAANGLFTLEGHIVRANDEFEMCPTDIWAPIHHKIRHRSKRQRGDIDGVYGLAKHPHMPPTAVYLDIDDILSIRARSPGYLMRPDSSPWKTDFEAMVVKSGVRAKGKRLPLRTTMIAAAMETQHEMGRESYVNKEGTLIVEGQVVDPSVGASDPVGDQGVREVGHTPEFEIQPLTSELRLTTKSPDIWAGQCMRMLERLSREQVVAFQDLNDELIDRAQQMGAAAQAHRVRDAITRKLQE